MNHPNIGHIYGLEEAEGQKALVLELVEGPTLADRIAQGAIPLDEALPIAKQITEALEAAHEAGVIHRDLKPANIKVKDDGTVKVLDFGLAKALDTAPEGDPSQSPTLTAAATQMGVIMGTAAYMSPEQARGKPVDRRGDIWAFGCVLYEMLTGQRAFDGTDVSLILAEVIKSEPQLDRLPSDTPVFIRRLVDRALAKERAKRLQHIGDARIEIEDSLDGREIETPPDKRSSVASHAATALAAAAVVGLLLWVVDAPTPQAPFSESVTRTTIVLPDGQRQSRAKRAPLAISPDGMTLAYVARDITGSHLFLRRLDEFETRRVPDTEDAFEPFFSHNGEWVGFFASGSLKKVRVTGGSPLTVTAAASGFGASWGTDDTILFAPSIGAGLWRVSADDGTPERLTEPDFAGNGYAHVWPQFLPGAKHALFSLWGAGGVDGPRLLDLETGSFSRIRNGVTGGDMYLASGHVAYADPGGSGAFLAAPFDTDSLSVTGSAIPVLDDVRFFGSQSGHPYIAVSQTGTAVYASHDIGDASIMWVDRDGQTTSIRRESRIVGDIRLSPNGRTAVFHDEQGGIWTLDVDRGSVDLLVQGGIEVGYENERPTWHPDGTHVTFASNRDGSWNLYEIDVTTRSEPTALLVRPRDQHAGSWSSDGRFLVLAEEHPTTGADIWMLPRGEEPTPIVQTAANEFSLYRTRFPGHTFVLCRLA